MQRTATKLKSDAQQLLLLADAQPHPPSRPPDLDYLAILPTVADAVEYAATLARKVPKQLYLAMEKDKTVWSRICSGEIEFPASAIKKYSQIVGNDALSLYVAHDNGWDMASMRKSMDDKDRRIFELEKKVAEKDRALEIAAQLVSGRVPR